MYVLQPEDDIVPKEFIGCKIDWKEGKDVTFEQVWMERRGRTCPGSAPCTSALMGSDIQA